MQILILGASYGSLMSTKLLMAGHAVTLVCLPEEAALINSEGTTVGLTLRGEDAPRLIRSADQPGMLNATTPVEANPEAYDLVALAMQEPQYRADEVSALLARIAQAGRPCLSIMNMPPLRYLQRIDGIVAADFMGALPTRLCGTGSSPVFCRFAAPIRRPSARQRRP